MNTPRPAADWRASYLSLTALLIRRREALRISQQDLADRLGVGRRTLQRWEHGEAEPPAMRLFQWAALLGVRIAPDVAQPGPSDGGIRNVRTLDDLGTFLGSLGEEEPDWRQVFLAWAEAQGINGDQWLVMLTCLLTLNFPQPRGDA